MSHTESSRIGTKLLIALVIYTVGCGGGADGADIGVDDEGAAELGVCVDEDGDGRGSGCSGGADCDDTDDKRGGPELPGDDIDNDCDGRVDEVGLVDACEGIDGPCESSPIGNSAVNGGEDFDLDVDPSDGVELDDDGALVLSSREINTSYIWIANTQEGTISKIDTRLKDENDHYVEVARYATGDENCGTDDPENFLGCEVVGGFSGSDPSRTTVNREGNVFVGDRAEGRVTMILTDNEECGDTNGDGLSNNTSAGAGDVLPWDTSDPDNPVPVDDCIKWTTDLQEWAATDEAGSGNVRRIRAMAAQDIEGLDGVLTTAVWVGDTDYRADGSNVGTIWKLDGATGDVLFSTKIDGCSPYGFALDANDTLWVSCKSSDSLARIDTRSCVDASCMDIATCQRTLGDPTCEDGSAVEDAVKEHLDILNTQQTYGMTVDFKQRVWIAGRASGRLYRYDPSQPIGSRGDYADLGSGAIRGVTADLRGFVYAANSNGSVHQVVGDDLTQFHTFTGMVSSTWGMATDLDGKVWAMGFYQDVADVITPTDELGVAEVQTAAAIDLVGTYTYSDMTGSQLRFATNPEGNYRHVFEGCSTTTDWLQLAWDAEAPAGTQVLWFIRSADTRSTLRNESFVRVAEVPGDKSVFALGSAMDDAGVEHKNFLEVQVQLKTDNGDPTRIVTPIVRAFDASHSCGIVLE